MKLVKIILNEQTLKRESRLGEKYEPEMNEKEAGRMKIKKRLSVSEKSSLKSEDTGQEKVLYQQN